MKWNSDLIINKTTLISRRIFWSFFWLFIFAGLISVFAEFYMVKWLNTLVAFVGGFSLILLAISWTTPGILILLGVPWLSYRWLRGINSTIPNKPWEQMSIWEKLLIYISSVIAFVAVVLGILEMIFSSV